MCNGLSFASTDRQAGLPDRFAGCRIWKSRDSVRDFILDKQLIYSVNIYKSAKDGICTVYDV